MSGLNVKSHFPGAGNALSVGVPAAGCSGHAYVDEIKIIAMTAKRILMVDFFIDFLKWYAFSGLLLYRLQYTIQQQTEKGHYNF